MALNNIQPLAFNPNLGGQNKTSSIGGFIPQKTTQSTFSYQGGSSFPTSYNPPQTTPSSTISAGVGGTATSPYQNLTMKNPPLSSSQTSAISPPLDTNPYSFANYYKAHPNANPANNSLGGDVQNTSGGDTTASGFTTQTNPQNGAPMAVPQGGTVNPDGSVTNNPNVNVGGVQPPPPTQYGVNNGLFGQLITGLANTAQIGNNPAIAQTQQQLSQLGQDFAKQNANIMGSRTNLSEAGGEQGLLQNLYQNTRAPLETQLQQQTLQQQLQQQGLASAAGLAAPQAVPYSSQYLTPFSGQPVGGGAAGGSLQTAVANVVQRLTSGQMTYNDALTALSGYGQGGLNALQQALPQGFNVAQSNTLAAQQGSIGPAISYAQQTLQNLKNIFSQLQVPGQQSNVPLLGSLAGLASSQLGIGKQQTTAMQGALAEARQALQSVLASVRGGIPTDYTRQSYSVLPDNATPADVDAAIQTLATLGAAKQQIYGNPGQANAPANTNSTSIWNW